MNLKRFFKKIKRFFQKKPIIDDSRNFFDSDEQERSFLDVAIEYTEKLMQEGKISKLFGKGILFYIFFARDTATGEKAILKIRNNDIEQNYKDTGFVAIEIRETDKESYRPPYYIKFWKYISPETKQKLDDFLEVIWNSDYLDFYIKHALTNWKIFTRFEFDLKKIIDFLDILNKAWFAKFGIKKNISPHFFRHNFAVKMIRKNASSVTIGNQGGWKSISDFAHDTSIEDIKKAWEDA